MNEYSRKREVRYTISVAIYMYVVRKHVHSPYRVAASVALPVTA